MTDPVDFAAERTRRLPYDTSPAEVTAVDTLAEALRDERERVAAGGAPTECCIVLMERSEDDGDTLVSRGYYGGKDLSLRTDAAERMLTKAIRIIVESELRNRGHE